MKKLPRTDPRARHIAVADTVDREGLVAFASGKHSFVLTTTRRDGRPQMSLVTGTMASDGTLLISTYPTRAKVTNLRRNPAASVLIMGDDFSAKSIQIDGEARVIDMPEAADTLVDYYRSISGEHPSWDEYRQAMTDQGKSVIRILPQRWGPINAGGFPPELFEDERGTGETPSA